MIEENLSTLIYPYQHTVLVKKQPIHIALRVQGYLLAFLIFISFGVKEWHIISEHSHAPIEICDAKAGDLHLHDYEHLQHECPLCDFTFSAFELVLPQIFDLLTPQKAITTRTFFYPSFDSFKSYTFALLRGPPHSIQSFLFVKN